MDCIETVGFLGIIRFTLMTLKHSDISQGIPKSLPNTWTTDMSQQGELAVCEDKVYRSVISSGDAEKFCCLSFSSFPCQNVSSDIVLVSHVQAIQT